MSEETKHVALVDLLERLSFAKRRMSTMKGDRETIEQAIQILIQMGHRLAELEAGKAQPRVELVS